MLPVQAQVPSMPLNASTSAGAGLGGAGDVLRIGEEGEDEGRESRRVGGNGTWFLQG